MTPAKGYTEMKDSGIEWVGEIPVHWEIARMKSILENVSIKNHPDAEVLSLYRDYGVLPKNSRDDNHNVTSEDTAQYKYVDVGNLVINKMKAWQGSLAVSSYEGIVSPAYYVCKFRSSKINKRYIHFLVRCSAYAQEFERLSTGMRVGQWDLGISDFMRVPVLLPPFPEQSAIASYLDTQCAKIDEIIAQAKASIENYKQWKASIIYEAVTKGLDPNVEMKDSGITWIGKIPAHWDYQKVFRCFNVIGSGTTPKSLDDDYYSGEIPWLQSGDINGWYVEETSKHITTEALNTFSALKIYEAPFIAVAMYGASIANTSIVSLDACTNQACCVLSEPAEKIEFEYIFYAILASKEELLLSARGGTQPNISQEIIRQLKLPIPPPKEQQRIITYLHKKVTEIDHLIGEKQSLIDDLESYKKSLIYEVVTGKRKV